MQPQYRALAILSCFCFGLSVEPTWQVARPAGAGCWPPRCQPGEIPLATPLVVHGKRLFMIGDGAAPNQAYATDDGKHWRGYRHDARWGVRYRAADASYAGALWRVGGFVEASGSRTLMNDVWRSEDGRHWQRLLEHAPWPPRASAHLVVFRDTLWLIGGEPQDGRIWGTTDGRSWSARSTASLPRANPQGVLVFRDALWIVGHGAWENATNDVWRSPDGVGWTRIAAEAQWASRTDPGIAVLADRLWVVGGAGHRDVWSSSDGRRWRRASSDLPGPPRAAGFSVVFADRYWVFGWKTGGLGGTGFWDGVVYLEQR